MFKSISIFSGLLGALAWLAHLELSPRLGNIWLRRDAEGIQRFSPGGLKALLVAPFYIKELWWPSMWDVNPWIVASILGVPWLLLEVANPSQVLPQLPHAADKKSL